MTEKDASFGASGITKGLSKLTVSQTQTPVSPNRGTVVFKSYRLCHRATNSENKSGSTQEGTTNTHNPENDIQLAKIPSGNSTRPPPPNKYKIRKFQIDNVRYYPCLYCNKHFDSIHHLNNHHKQNHPPVSCDVCNKLYDMSNS